MNGSRRSHPSSKAIARALGCALLLLAAGCGDEPMPAPGPCAGLTLGTDAKVTAAIATHVPVALTTYCSAKARIAWEGGVVDLIYLAYGSAPTLPDPCPGGTCANTVCALDYGNGVSLLFDAVWANNEPPLTIGAECPAIALDATGDTATQCTAPPVSGRQHPVMADPQFRDFLQVAPIPGQFAVCGRDLPPGER